MEEARGDTFVQEDHQAAYVLDADDDGGEARRERPSKRRMLSKQTAEGANVHDSPWLFVPLLNGTETAASVRLRQRLFDETWAWIDGRIQAILRESNSATLAEVSAFAAAAEMECADQIPSAFIITGPNIASQDLLFEQLSETLQTSVASRFVRLRSSEAPTLKAALRKTIRDATAHPSPKDHDDLQVESEQYGRRYLDYDLEALEAFIKHQRGECKHVFVAFEDSEGFDSGLISDLIALFLSWRPRIPFTLLFGIATSVELLQARLLKSACRLIHGAQFDCVQKETILETVIKEAVAASDIPLRLGSQLLQSMLDRQRDQIAGIQAFISSLKYAYMCHFYANPLSITISRDAFAGDVIQAEHIEALRNLPSFRRHVERAVQLGSEQSLQHARSLIVDDEYLMGKARDSERDRQQWIDNILRSLLVLEAAGAQDERFSQAYAHAVAGGAVLSEHSRVVDCIRRMSVEALSALLTRTVALFKEGDARLNLAPSADDKDAQVASALETQLGQLEELGATAESKGLTLRSRYSGQIKVMRTTVIAQRVQLSQDSAALRDEDRRLTEIVDEVTRVLTGHFGETDPDSIVFSECWLYDSRWPAREVFVPRPRAVFERSLGRPHDYLGCGEEGMQGGVPATSMLYQLYLEAGSLINVADLWSAFQTLVEGAGQEGDRRTVVLFYQGLAELRALGFVKASKRKADHMAKVRWL